MQKYFDDIGAGVCYTQKMATDGYDLTSVSEYKPKTKIPEIINNELNDIDKDLKEKFGWNKKDTFKSNIGTIKVLKYSHNTFDWALIEVNGEERKISKKWLNELWEKGGEI